MSVLDQIEHAAPWTFKFESVMKHARSNETRFYCSITTTGMFFPITLGSKYEWQILRLIKIIQFILELQ